jgi:DNA gyrase/topoisomerase IV subunit A
MPLDGIETSKRSRPIRNMRLNEDDEVVSVQVLSGNSNILVLTSNGMASLFNENDLNIVTSKAGGVKSIFGLGDNDTVAFLSYEPNEKGKFIMFTNKGHYRLVDSNKLNLNNRLGKPQVLMPCFKSDVHKVICAFKIDTKADVLKTNLFLDNNEYFAFDLTDFSATDLGKYAKKNISIPAKTLVSDVFDINIEVVNDKTISHPTKTSRPVSQARDDDDDKDAHASVTSNNEEGKNEDNDGFVQISIFDDLD